MSSLPSWLYLPPAAPAQVVHTRSEKVDVNIGRGSAYDNPFLTADAGDRGAVRFREWLKEQPELLRLARQVLPGKRIGCFCESRPCHGDVYAEIAAGHWDALIPDEPIFVFGSNLAGRHGAGAALSARREYGAVNGIGRGLTGHAYALPTKDTGLNTRTLDHVLAELDHFFALTEANPHIQYRMTRVGCGLAGLPEEEIRNHVLERAPANILLPGVWESHRRPGLARVVVAGSREVDGYERIADKLDLLLSQLSDVEIISGGARGPDTLGERYAVERGLQLRRMPALWDAFGLGAGPIRNRRMSWYGTHLVAFWDGKSRGTKTMFEIAREDGLATRVVAA